MFPKVLININQMFRQAARPAVFASKFSTPRFSPIASRYLSNEVRKQIDQVVGSKPVVLFMKGTPESPMCGFSKATISILSLQGLDPEKFAALNVLEDEGLRQGQSLIMSISGIDYMESNTHVKQESKNTLSGQPYPNFMSTRNL